jgi:hypothetical protein
MLPDLPPVFTGRDPGDCNSNNDCTPSIESSQDDVLISATAGTVLIDTVSCGKVDVCELRQSLGAVSAALASLSKDD